MPKKTHKKKIIKRPTFSGPCYFCEKNVEPSYLNPEELSQFLSDRSKIIGVDFTGLCSKHQRKLSQSVKRARHLSLLAYRPRI